MAENQTRKDNTSLPSEGQEIHGQVMEWRPRCAVECVDESKGATLCPEANFLSPNTDLNLPPSNWLRSSSQVEKYIRDCRPGWKPAQAQFSSFQMGYDFPEVIGEVDVISDSENIKKLLKIPYNKAHVSMMVHRIRKTLLLDDFDIHKHLLRQQQEDWNWMKKFYEETVARNNEETMKCVPKKDKSRDYLQSMNLYSKFLYYSVSDTDNNSSDPCEDNTSSKPERNEAEKGESDLQVVPDNQQPTKDSGFHREVLWTFEDIKMLIGTDLPIFRAGHHPCVSVRLRDMSKPVNVLTGMDYWLDNLMCNVPELAMCYHLNGIVQNYELIKTPDIPDLDNSKFSPQEVTDIAKNILSFLKSNATKEGHTYWLYKGADDDVVKLYDLTTLCADDMEKKGENPFTVPLGMLLYKVARNMRERTFRKHASTIRTLLNTCIMLLDEDVYPQIFTSANYLLSDLYVPDNVVSDVWGLSANSEESDSEFEEDSEQREDDQSETSKSVKVQSLSQPELSEKKKTAIVKYNRVAFGTAEEKCRESLKCIHKGIRCLGKLQNECTGQEEEEQATCNPDEAIPLFYHPLHPNNTSDTTKSTDCGLENSLSAFHLNTSANSPTERWHLRSKVLLYRKAAMAYYSLAVIAMESHRYGTALKYIKLAVLSFGAMTTLSTLKGEDNKMLLSVILSTVGDIRLMIAHNTHLMEVLQEDFLQLSETDTQILSAIEEDLPNFGNMWMYTLTDGIEENLNCCCRCYDEAIQVLQNEEKTDQNLLESLTKRLGNAKNELGVLYMNQAMAVATGKADWRPLEQLENVWKLSYGCFDRGIQAFESVGDVANQAFLLSNVGQLMRICAQCHTLSTRDQQPREFSPGERHYYTKAISYYQKALKVLGNKNQYPQIWESVNWELSTSYFNMAMLLQDNAPVSSVTLEQVEKEIIDLMNKALAHCDTEKKSVRTTGQQYRAAIINHRLASLHHSTYRNQVSSDQKQKYLKQLALNHYSKAASLYENTESFNDFLRVQLEQVALSEFAFEEAVNVGLKCKILESALGYLLSCQKALANLEKLSKERHKKDGTGVIDLAESGRLLDIFKSRLQHTLLSLAQHYNKINKGKGAGFDKVGLLKKLYSLSLQKLAKDDSGVNVKCHAALDVISEINQVWSIGDHS